MSDPIKFAASAADFNARAAAVEKTITALEAEREILLETSRDSGVMVGHARKMLAKVSHSISFPEGYTPPAKPAEQPAAPIIRHPEQAAE